MSDAPRPVLGRPPADADDEELEEWAEQLLDAVLGLVPGDDERS